MNRKRHHLHRGALAVLRFASAGVPALFLAVVACSSSLDAGQGGTCALASDCAPGLVCVPQKGGARTCTSDLSGVGGTVPTQPSTPDAAATPAGDGGALSDGGGRPDAVAPPPPKDSGAPPVDKPDSAPPPPDASAGGMDSSAPPPDAGVD